MNTPPLSIPDKNLVLEIYLRLLTAYQQRCAKDKLPMDREYLERLMKESIQHAQLCDSVYQNFVNTSLTK